MAHLASSSQLMALQFRNLCVFSAFDCKQALQKIGKLLQHFPLCLQGIVTPGEHVVFLPTHTGLNTCMGKILRLAKCQDSYLRMASLPNHQRSRRA